MCGSIFRKADRQTSEWNSMPNFPLQLSDGIIPVSSIIATRRRSPAFPFSSRIKNSAIDYEQICRIRPVRLTDFSRDGQARFSGRITLPINSTAVQLYSIRTQFFPFLSTHYRNKPLRPESRHRD